MMTELLMKHLKRLIATDEIAIDEISRKSDL